MHRVIKSFYCVLKENSENINFEIRAHYYKNIHYCELILRPWPSW
jgi:hypothetical protein